MKDKLIKRVCPTCGHKEMIKQQWSKTSANKSGIMLICPICDTAVSPGFLNDLKKEAKRLAKEREESRMYAPITFGGLEKFEKKRDRKPKVYAPVFDGKISSK